MMAWWSEVLRKDILLDYIYNNSILNLSLKHPEILYFIH